MKKFNTEEKVVELQIQGWKLLNKYLNSGLGRLWFLYPMYIGESSDLKKEAKYLAILWEEYGRNANINLTIDFGSVKSVAEVLSNHYIILGKILSGAGGVKRHIDIKKFNSIRRDKTLKKFYKAVGKIEFYFHSYWLHGSLGTNEIKPGWSDFDGLAIIRNSVCQDSASLKKLRRRMIDLRKYMVDFCPAQIHGHFVVTEIDLCNYLSPFFPIVLFDFATCLTSNSYELIVNEVWNQKFALNVLWEHGIHDLIHIENNDLSSEIKKFLFLHRIYLLPSLIFQVVGNPKFKKEAIASIDLIFWPDEVVIFNEINEIWSKWTPPNVFLRSAITISRLFRINPLLYNMVTKIIVDRIRWFRFSDSLDWEKIQKDVAGLAENLWIRYAGNAIEK